MSTALVTSVVLALTPAATYDEQPVITDWPLRIAVSVLFVAGLTALALWGMRRGWRHRQERQADIPAPPTTPPDGTTFELAIPSHYLGAARLGDWLDRIAVHDLGVRSLATLHLGSAGIWIERVGARSIWLDRSALAGARIDRGVAGTVRQRDRVLILQWQFPGGVVELGVRADERADHAAGVGWCMASGLLASDDSAEGDTSMGDAR